MRLLSIQAQPMPWRGRCRRKLVEQSGRGWLLGRIEPDMNPAGPVGGIVSALHHAIGGDEHAEQSGRN